MADVAKTVAIVFEGQDKTGSAISAVESGLKGIGTESASAASKVDGLADQMGALGDKADKVELLSASIKALAGSLIAKAFIDANVEAERFDRAMTSIKGSSAAAATEFDYVKTLANRLGLELFSTASAYTDLSAATKGTALEGQASRDIFEAVSRAMSSLGKSSEDTKGALLAISQIVSKGTVSLEELRGQLGERLPGAFAIAASAMGVTTAELDKLVSSGKLTAEEFLPRFADALDRAFADTGPVDGFTAAMNRLRNQIDETLIAVGKAGAFDTLAGGVGKAGELVGGLAVVFEVLGRDFTALINLLRGGSFDVFNAEIELSQKKLADYSDSIAGPDGLNQSLAETARLTRQAAEAARENGDQSDAETARLLRQASAQADAVKAVGEAFKTLGVNPEKIRKDVAEIVSAFDTLAKSSDVKGGALLDALEASLKRIRESPALESLRDSLTAAFNDGRLSAAEFDLALKAVNERQTELQKGTATSAAAIKKQAEETKKAEEAAARMRLELEKLASNERIKLIEARVAINVAQVEADTKRIQAAFESINVTINSTADVINKAFAILSGKDFIDSTIRNKLLDQIDIENENRREALRLQSTLTAAQVEVLRAQAASLSRGDAMIKVDGAGLKPHLEAFMWEILKAVQVRVNSEGLKLLLGV